MSLQNRFRFSCEFMDDELGLVYYNYRHLNPLDGKWINRDPIQEQGGWNLYGVGGNALYISFDYLGLWLSRRHRRLTRRPLSTYQFYLIISGTEISFYNKRRTVRNYR